MTIGGSLVLIAIGAILKYAVTAHISGVDIGTVGVVLMVVGVVGLIISIVWLLNQRRRLTGPAVVERPRYAEPVAPRRVAREHVVREDVYDTPPVERPVAPDPYDPRV